MIKVTVLYNLPPGADEEAFLRWRTGEHQTANAAAPGVLRADFYRVLGTPQVGPDRPAGAAPYRFVTESYWPDLASFRAAWDDPAEQARIVAGVARIADALFLVAEEVRTADAAPDQPSPTAPE